MREHYRSEIIDALQGAADALHAAWVEALRVAPHQSDLLITCSQQWKGLVQLIAHLSSAHLDPPENSVPCHVCGNKVGVPS